METVLKVENVSINYKIGDFIDIGLKEYILRKLSSRYEEKYFKAVSDVSFTLEKGDMLGIVGVNGAGKSTLLKSISGIMTPTFGHIHRVGSIAALLELGSGFDSDSTVKENTYLRGAMLGYSRAFMDKTYDSIIDFAELKGFEDRQFKQLSSGMQSRLAFSIACLVEPDILILDEVLSVGDGAFQEKSGNKMREILNSGVTGLFVSHSLSQVKSLCNKVLWLHKGKQIAFGETEIISEKYQDFLNGKISEDELSSIVWENEKERKRLLKTIIENESENCIMQTQNDLETQTHSPVGADTLKKTDHSEIKPLSDKIIVVDSGENNIINIGENLSFGSNALLRLVFDGNNNEVVIGDNVHINSVLNIKIEKAGEDAIASNSSCKIGDNCNFNGSVLISLGEENTHVRIGDDCLFADGISMFTSDNHCIYDIDSLERVNTPSNIVIGNHVWVCNDVLILNNSFVSDDSVIATRALVNKKFNQKNVVIGGLPAKIIRQNCNWDRWLYPKLEKN